MVEFRQLRYFVAVARHMHFNRAAAELHIAQPSLTHAIKQLEETLGVALFERTTRSVRLTAAGRAFHQEALRTLEQVEATCQAARRAASGERGRLSIGFVTTAIMGDLKRMIRLFHEQFPDVDLVLREMLINDLVEELHSDSLALICADGEVTDAAFEARPILSPSWVRAVHRSDPLASQRSVTLSQAMRQPFVVATDHPSHNLHRKMIEACHSAHFQPDVQECADSVPCAVALVEAKMGVAMVYNIPACRPADVVYKKLAGCDMDVRMHLCWRRGALSPAAANFVRIN
ncbi:MAG: LysR family transcriptional regulator [Telmatospirillum sp.]|nr:LysR family transcriptional regulator [Telmatospirillum sp.]